MSRQVEETELKCPLCGEFLDLIIEGEFNIDDHEYGFFDTGMASGYTCKNDHDIFIKTGEIEDDNY